jgi:hypothetical protein
MLATLSWEESKGKNTSLPPAKTGILDPMPKLLRFHMSALAICPYTPNKEAW